MYNPDTEILFPMRVLPALRTLHGDEWRKLVDFVLSPDSLPSDRYALELMMVKMCGCAGCNADSFRAMRGCTQCARQMVRRNRNNDLEIAEQFKLVQKEVNNYMIKLESETSSASRA